MDPTRWGENDTRVKAREDGRQAISRLLSATAIGGWLGKQLTARYVAVRVGRLQRFSRRVQSRIGCYDSHGLMARGASLAVVWELSWTCRIEIADW